MLKVLVVVLMAGIMENGGEIYMFSRNQLSQLLNPAKSGHNKIQTKSFGQ